MEKIIKDFDDYNDEKKLKNKLELIQSLNNVVTPDGLPYFNKEWIEKHILMIDKK